MVADGSLKGGKVILDIGDDGRFVWLYHQHSQAVHLCTLRGIEVHFLKSNAVNKVSSFLDRIAISGD